MFGQLWMTFLNMVYPPKCPGCKILVDEHGAWCLKCARKIVAVRLINLSAHNLVALDSCLVVCKYTGSLKRIIHDMKFRRQKRQSIYLEWLINKYIESSFFDSFDYVVPVPLHEKRLQERGYNQTEAIFKGVFKKSTRPRFVAEKLWLPELLRRKQPTIPQWELNLTERKRNINDAFVVACPEMVKNKKILLVDDIVTTGITLDECAKVLKNAGASSVYALVVASGA